MDIQSKEWLLLMLGVIFGGGFGIATTRYYFRQGFVKSLSPYLMFHASPMSGMSSDVRSALNVEFKGRKVANLIEAQFLVVNDGAKALRDVIGPLTVTPPQGLRILDAQVVQTQSSDLTVNTTIQSDVENVHQLRLSFDLLNAREWFIVKVIADGPAASDDWSWSIVADELPRRLQLQRFTLEDLGKIPVSSKERKALALRALAYFAAAGAGMLLFTSIGAWYTENLPKESYWGIFFGLVQFVIGIFTFAVSVNAGSAVVTCFRGLRPWGRLLPHLSAEVIEDVWRGHSAQADAVELLRKINNKEA